MRIWAVEIARLDGELVRRGLARSRGQAAELVRSGAVTVDGRQASKPAWPVESDSVLAIDATQQSPWVNRGAEKLAHALAHWRLPVTGRRCLDVGASTGGFTQVLLHHGAGQVVALDVGHGQLHTQVALDPRVVNLEGTSIRDVALGADGPLGVSAFDVIVADLSFISLRLVMNQIAALLAVPEAEGKAASPWVVVLVKPQFEVGRERLGKGGIVTRAEDRALALRQVLQVADQEGLVPAGLLRSPITGSHGNTEYLVWLVSDPSARMDPDMVEATITRLAETDQNPAEDS